MQPSDTPFSVIVLAPGKSQAVILQRGDRVLVRRGCVRVAQHVRRPRMPSWKALPWMDAFTTLKPGAYLIACDERVTGVANVVITRRGAVCADLVEASR